MSRLSILTRHDVARLLPPIPEQIEIVKRTHRAIALGEVELPPKPGIHPREDAFIHAMPAYLREEDFAAIKWVSGYPGNPAKGLPYISGVIVVNDSETGLPIALMDAAEITAARTAAASGACLRRWGPDGWHTAAILGLGEQGRAHVRLLRSENPDAEIRIFDINAARLTDLDASLIVTSSPGEAVRGAEVVVTASPIREHPDPPITHSWLGPSYLLLPLDFDSYVHRDAVEQSALFVVDDVAQFEYYREQGFFAEWPTPQGSIGDLLETPQPKLESVVCANLGIGALDAAFAAAVLRGAKEAGVGTVVEL